MEGIPERLASYYRSPAVRARLREYAGETCARESRLSTWSIAGYGGARRLSDIDGGPVERPMPEWGRLLDEGADVCRSLVDLRGLVLLLDVDFVSPARPADPYCRPRVTFSRIEPVHRSVRRVAARLGIPFLDVVTGCGYHFAAFAAHGSAFYQSLLRHGRVDPRLAARYAALSTDGVDLVESGRAHDGAGRLLELLAHEVIRDVADEVSLPLRLADLPERTGGPFVCLDVSAHGDPVDHRYVRCAFSGNQKASMKALRDTPPTVCVPRGKTSLHEVLEVRRNPMAASDWAVSVHAEIPTVPARAAALWPERYVVSGLAELHRLYDSGWHDDPGAWPQTYDRLAMQTLPADVRAALAHPNPALLQPVHIRRVARTLWRRGWHPRSVAGLIRSKYERDHGWGPYWYSYDASARADFFVRLFFASAMAGLDPE